MRHGEQPKKQGQLVTLKTKVGHAVSADILRSCLGRSSSLLTDTRNMVSVVSPDAHLGAVRGDKCTVKRNVT